MRKMIRLVCFIVILSCANAVQAQSVSKWKAFDLEAAIIPSP